MKDHRRANTIENNSLGKVQTAAGKKANDALDIIRRVCVGESIASVTAILYLAALR